MAGVAASAALTGASRPAIAAGSRNSPNVYDFGAVGDGVTDDSAAFSRALQYAAANTVMVTVPAGVYGISNTITFVSQGNVGQAWGFQCQGATLLSHITNGGDVMSLTSWHSSVISA